MNDKIVTVTLTKCSGCRYAQKFDAKGFADCFGQPPSVHVIGAARDALGRPALQLEMFVPRIHQDRPACALYQGTLNFATTGSS